MDTERLSSKELLRLRRKETLDGQAVPALSPRPASIKKRIVLSILTLAVVATDFGAGYYVADSKAEAREAVLATSLTRTTDDLEELQTWAATASNEYNTLRANYMAASQALSDAQNRAAAAQARASLAAGAAKKQNEKRDKDQMSDEQAWLWDHRTSGCMVAIEC